MGWLGSKLSAEKILFISHYFPPLIGGSSVLMGALVKPFPKGSIHIIRGQPHNAPIDINFQIEHPQTIVKLPNFYKRDGNRLLPLLYLAFICKALRIRKIFRFNAIFVCWPTHWHLEFAFRLSKLLKLPLYVYMHDMWADNRKTVIRRSLASLFEKRILKHAKMVYAITEEAAAHFEKKYDVVCKKLEHSLDWNSVKNKNRFLKKREHENFNIVHLGGIYSMMNQDSVIRINDAVQLMPKAHMWVHLQERDDLSELGLIGERLTKKPLKKEEVIEHLEKADIVCLPLSFDSWAKTEINTVFPTRCLEFFICGRPILVHAPKESFLAKDARKKGWGFVIDTPNVKAISDAIEKLLSDESLQRNLVAAAWKEAHRRDSSEISKQLQQELNVD